MVDVPVATSVTEQRSRAQRDLERESTTTFDLGIRGCTCIGSVPKHLQLNTPEPRCRVKLVAQ